jgi:hypothetical protein
VRESIKSPNQLEVLFERPHIVMFRQILTPNYETLLFLDIANKYKLRPFIIEYYEDKFVSTGNSYKRGLGKLPIHKLSSSKGEPVIEYGTIVDFNKNVGLELKNVKTVQNESLVELHHDMFEFIVKRTYKDIFFDASNWFKLFNKSQEYYNHFLRLFVRDAILFETFLTDGPEYDLTFNTVVPAFNKCRQELNFKPLIVHATYEDSSDDPAILDYYPKETAEFLTTRGYN